MKKALKFVKGKLNDKKEHGGGGLGPFSMELPSPGTPVDEDHSMPVDHAWGYYVDTSGKDKSVTKLHKAAWLGNLDKLKVNLKKIDIDAVDKSNRTPLHLACASGHTNLVWFLLNNKAKMTICDNEGRTPFLKAIECGHKDMVQLMLEKGVDITTVDYSGNSGLHIAAKRGLYEISLILLKEGAHFETSNILGEFPLHIATWGEHKDLVELLVRYGSSVNVVDRDHRSPLMFAAKNGNMPLVQLFLSKGAQRRVMDAQDWTAEDYALHGNHLDVAAELKSPSRGDELVPSDAVSLARRSVSPANRSAKDADSDTWESVPSEDNAVKPVAFRRFVPPSSEDEASEGEGVIPPPCRPPRSWELLTSGAMDPSEPRPRSLLALGSLRTKRESLENGESPSGRSEAGQGDAAQWVASHSFSKREAQGRVPSIELDGRQLPLDGRTESLGSDSEWDSDGSLPLDSVPVATGGAKQRVLLRVPPVDLNDEDAELKELQRERSDSSHGNSKASGTSLGNSKASGASHGNSKASGASHGNSKASGASHGNSKASRTSRDKEQTAGSSPGKKQDIGSPANKNLIATSPGNNNAAKTSPGISLTAKPETAVDLLAKDEGPDSLLGKVEIFERLLRKEEPPESVGSKDEAAGGLPAADDDAADKVRATEGPREGRSPDRGTLGRPGTLLGYDEVWESGAQASWQPRDDELLFPSPQLTEKSMDADSLESPPPTLPPPPVEVAASAAPQGARLKSSTSLDFKKQTLAAYLHTASLSLDELDEPARRWQERDRTSWAGPGPGFGPAPGLGRSLAESRRIDAQLACYDEALRDLARVSRPRPQRYLSLPRSNQLIDDAFKEMGHVSRSLPRTAAPADMVAEPLPPPRRRRRADSEGDRLGQPRRPLSLDGLGQSRRPLSLDDMLPEGAEGGKQPDRSSEEDTGSPAVASPARDSARRRSSDKPIRRKRKTLLALRGLNHDPPNGSQSSGGEVGDSFEEQPFTISMDVGKGQLPRQCTVVERKDFRIASGSKAGTTPGKVGKAGTPRSVSGKSSHSGKSASAKSSRSGSRELLGESGTSDEADAGLPPPPEAFSTGHACGESRCGTKGLNDECSVELVNYLPSDDSEFSHSRSEESPRQAYGLQHASSSAQLSALRMDKRACEERAARLHETVQRLEYELADAREAARCREDVTQLLQSQLDAMEAKYAACLAELEQCRQSIRAQELELVHLKETCHAFGEEKEILHEIIKARDVEMDDLDKALRDKDYDRILRITRQLKNKETEHTEMKYQVIDLEREKQKSLEDIVDLEKRNRELELKLERSMKQVKELSQGRPENNEAHMWKELYESCLCKIEKMATTEEDFRSKTAPDRLAHADDFRAELREIIRRLEELKEGKDGGTYRARIQEEVANAVALLREEYAAVGRTAAKHNEQLEQLVQKLQRDLEQAEQRRERLETELAAAERDLKAARSGGGEVDQSAMISELRKVGGDMRERTELVRTRLDQHSEEMNGRMDEIKGFHRTELELLKGLRTMDDLKAANEELSCRCSRLVSEAAGAGQLGAELLEVRAELAKQRAAFAEQGAELERTLLVLKDTRNAATAACAREIADLKQRIAEAEAETERVRSQTLCAECAARKASPVKESQNKPLDSSVVNSLKSDKIVEPFVSGPKVDNRTSCPCPSNAAPPKIVLTPLKKPPLSNIALAESRSRSSFKNFDSEKEMENHLPTRCSTMGSLGPSDDDNAKQRKNQDAAANKLKAEQFGGCTNCFCQPSSPGHFEQSEAEFRRQINELEQKVREENSKRFALEVEVNKMRYDLQEKMQLEKELGILRNRLEQDFVSRYELEQMRKTYEVALSRYKLDAEKTAVNDLNNKIGQISMLMDKQQQEPSCESCANLSPEFQEARLKISADVACAGATLRAEKEEEAERRKLIEKGYCVNLAPGSQSKDRLMLVKPRCKCSPNRCQPSFCGAEKSSCGSNNSAPYKCMEKSPCGSVEKSPCASNARAPFIRADKSPCGNVEKSPCPSNNSIDAECAGAKLRAEKEEEVERRKLIEKGYCVNLAPGSQSKDKLMLVKPRCKCSPNRCQPNFCGAEKSSCGSNNMQAVKSPCTTAEKSPCASNNRAPYVRAEKSACGSVEKSACGSKDRPAYGCTEKSSCGSAEKNPYTAVMRRELEKTISKHSQDALCGQSSSTRSCMGQPDEKDDIIRKNFFTHRGGSASDKDSDEDCSDRCIEPCSDDEKPATPVKSKKAPKPPKPEKPPKEKGKRSFSFGRRKKSPDSATEDKPKKSLFCRKKSSKTRPPRPETPEEVSPPASPKPSITPPPRPEPPKIESRPKRRMPPPRPKTKPKPSAQKSDSNKEPPPKASFQTTESRSPCGLMQSRPTTPIRLEGCSRHSKPSSCNSCEKLHKHKVTSGDNCSYSEFNCYSSCSLHRIHPVSKEPSSCKISRKSSCTDEEENCPPRRKSSLVYHRDSEYCPSNSRSKTRLANDDKIRKNFFTH